MKLSVCKKISGYDFIYTFVSILKNKGIIELNINELKYFLNYFSLFDRYQYLFNNIYQDIDIDTAIKILEKTRFIFKSESNHDKFYIIGDNESNHINDNEFRFILNQMVDEYIKLINGNKKVDDIKVMNPNCTYYKLFKGIHDGGSIKWDLITDGDINLMCNIESKKYYPDIRDNRIVYFSNEIENKKIILENATFAIKQGLADDVIVKNILYAECLSNQKFDEICRYFNQKEIDDPKVKRLSL